jgi:hypothetical protein
MIRNNLLMDNWTYLNWFWIKGKDNPSLLCDSLIKVSRTIFRSVYGDVKIGIN